MRINEKINVQNFKSAHKVLKSLNLIFLEVMNFKIKYDWIQLCIGLLFQVTRALLLTVYSL